MATFTWAVQAAPTGTETARVKSAQFGDGYQQIAKDGINNLVNSWAVSLAGASADVLAARDFLRERGGLPFQWTPPNDVPGLYSCTSWQRTPQGGDAHTLSATFNQVFSP